MNPPRNHHRRTLLFYHNISFIDSFANLLHLVVGKFRKDFPLPSAFLAFAASAMEVASFQSPFHTATNPLAMDSTMDIDMDIDLGPLPDVEGVDPVRPVGNLTHCSLLTRCEGNSSHIHFQQ